MSTFATPPSGDAAPLSQDLAGTTLDRYKLDALLGKGGMGSVYGAVHTITKRRCALKVLPDELSREPGFVERFRTEAQLLARLNHPCVVQIFSGGEDKRRFFLEMEFVDGGDLQQKVLQEYAASNRGLPEKDAYRVAESVLKALECAHGQSIIHRDLKPANILLSKTGDVKVSDFGLATFVSSDLQRSKIEASLSLSRVNSDQTMPASDATQVDSFVGTILYMSPQALRLEKPDMRDDLFSLGVTMYFTLLGRTPTLNYTPVKRQRKDLRYDWDRFIRKCLAEDRKDRYQTAKEALLDLERIGRSRTPMYLLAAGAVLGTAACAAAAMMFLKEPEAPDSSQSSNEPFVSNGYAQPPISAAPTQTPSASPTKILTASPDTGSDAVPETSQTPLSELKGSDVALSPPSNAPGIGATEPARTGREAIAQRSQAISLPQFPKRVMAGSILSVNADASSGLPVSLEVLEGPARIDGGKLAITGAGQITLRLFQPGNKYFLPTDEVVALTAQADMPKQIVLCLPGGVAMAFVRVPSGRTLLGSTQDEWGRGGDEAQRPYQQYDDVYFSATEVTQGQFRSLMNRDPSFFRGEDGSRPVEQVRYVEVAEETADSPSSYLGKINHVLQEQGFGDWKAGLPTEDEWEYACRAGSLSPFHNGAEVRLPLNESSIAAVAVYKMEQTMPVGGRQPNGWGLFDMHGNVAEWTQGGTTRGGSYRDSVAAIRAAARVAGAHNAPPSRRAGFRIVLRRIKE